MNPNTGELRALELGERPPRDFETVPKGFLDRIAQDELKAARAAGHETAHINLQSRHPLAKWAKKKRLAEDQGFATQVTGDRPLRRNVDGVCTRSTCECEREGLGDQCVWLKPVEAEFECLGEPSLCANPRGCACVPDSKTPNVKLSWSQRPAKE